ncbi:MAG: flagellar export chaperone FlgN [Calditrichia bacterium]
MEQGKLVLHLLKERIKLLSELKNLLMQQQKVLVTSDTEQITYFAELQVKCMENIQTLEEELRGIISEVKVAHNLKSHTIDQAISMILDETGNNFYFAYRDQLRKLASEIEVIKKNNTLLIHNALGLVQSTLKHLHGGRLPDAVYHPGKKQAMGHLLLNKTL